MASDIKTKDDKKAMAADTTLAPGADEPSPPRDERPSGERPAPPRPGFFTIYKKGQGYWTRMGTAVGAALLGGLTTWQIYAQVPKFFANTDRGERVALIVAASFAVLFIAFVWRLINKPANVDFLIATDSEMKKVNWTSRKDLIGSTKVVILFMFAIAVILFLYDILFNSLFWMLDVLKIAWWEQIFPKE